MPNFDPIGPKLPSLEGVKIFRKTGSGTKSRWKFKKTDDRNLRKNEPEVSAKFQGNRTTNKDSGRFRNVAKYPQGEIPVEPRNGKLLCIPE